jgi:hypothetical protein
LPFFLQEVRVQPRESHRRQAATNIITDLEQGLAQVG